jgi:hypothetical protein
MVDYTNAVDVSEGEVADVVLLQAIQYIFHRFYLRLMLKYSYSDVISQRIQVLKNS